MIRPFGLHDIWLVRQLQHQGLSLAVEHQLTHPRQPIWTALSAPWPWAGTGVATFVHDDGMGSRGVRGFVQLAKRTDRPEADLLHLAPAYAADGEPSPVIGALWQQLLSDCATEAARHGLQRLFASVPDGCDEQSCLKSAGFSYYTREVVYRLNSAQSGIAATVGYRPLRSQDAWALQRLYQRSTPRLVQQAEGALTGDVGSPLLSWWEPNKWHGVIWEPNGEVLGAAQLHIGRTGHWLRTWGGNAISQQELRTLVQQGLGLIDFPQRGSRRRMLPVYATVRDYENGLSGVLSTLGFVPFVVRARFVRHMTSFVREPLPATMAAHEARGEVPVRSQGAHGTQSDRPLA